MLKSGYVAVMTEEARLCYHAVPRKFDIFTLKKLFLIISNIANFFI